MSYCECDIHIMRSGGFVLVEGEGGAGDNSFIWFSFIDFNTKKPFFKCRFLIISGRKYAKTIFNEKQNNGNA